MTEGKRRMLVEEDKICTNHSGIIYLQGFLKKELSCEEDYMYGGV